jgi:hypothetical protein
MVNDSEEFVCCVREHPNEQPLSGISRGTVSVHVWMFKEQFTQPDPRKREVLFEQYQRQRAANKGLVSRLTLINVPGIDIGMSAVDQAHLHLIEPRSST